MKRGKSVVPGDWRNTDLRPVCSESRGLTRLVPVSCLGHRTERSVSAGLTVMRLADYAALHFNTIHKFLSE